MPTTKRPGKRSGVVIKGTGPRVRPPKKPRDARKLPVYSPPKKS